MLSHPWLYPALEITHIVGIALLFGSLLMVEWRLWGRSADLPLLPLARLGLRMTLFGFALAAASGLTMFLTQPTELLGNRPFQLKLVLLSCAGLNALVFHLRGGVTAPLGRTARGQTLLSLALWLAIIICGRWIAYY